MNEKEIDEILNEIKNRNNNHINKNEPEPTFSFAKNEDSVDFESKINDDEIEEVKEPDDSDAFNTDEIEIEKEESAEEKTDEVQESKDIYFSDYADDEYDEVQPKKKRNKALIVVLIICVLVAIGVGVYFGFFYNKNHPEPAISTTQSTTKEQTTVDNSPKNPLTGEHGFSEDALNKRPVAVVVENEYSTASVKPQWGLKEADIVLEGESEFSTRMLLFYADYKSIPSQVGPTRSARPPFIYFSQLFDAVFIHAGLSRSRDGYVGADSVFENENIDHINLLSLSESGKYFGRDYSRTRTVEHTGFLNGENVEELLEEKNIKTTLNTAKFTNLSFNENVRALSDTPALKVGFKWSSNCPKKAEFSYDESKHKYVTTDFDSQFGTSQAEWENLLFLLDNTQYVSKPNYKGTGRSEIYCNYDLSGGKGLLCSEGTCVEITWGVSDSKLWFKDANGKEISFNPGKTYIGYGSSNHAGEYSIITDTQE